MPMMQAQIDKEAHRIAAEWMDQCNVDEWAEPDSDDDLVSIQSAFDALMDEHRKSAGMLSRDEEHERAMERAATRQGPPLLPYDGQWEVGMYYDLWSKREQRWVPMVLTRIDPQDDGNDRVWGMPTDSTPIVLPDDDPRQISPEDLERFGVWGNKYAAVWEIRGKGR